jgi:molecular chaperone GrpE
MHEKHDKKSHQSDQSDQKKEVVDWQDVAKRAMADLDNYKKQAEKDKFEMLNIMKAGSLVKFMEVYDDLERALEYVEDAKAKEGVELVRDKFKSMLESEGMEALHVETGDAFDPMTMEAVSYEENEKVQDNNVIEMVETGLKYKDRIIKPAKVRVGK